MTRSAAFHSLLLGSALVLFLVPRTVAEDLPTLHGVRVAIVHTDPTSSDDANTRIALFEQYFKTARYLVQVERGQSPEEVLATRPEVALAVAGTFRTQSDLPLMVELYWRPDGKRSTPEGKVPIFGKGASHKAVEDAALGTIRYIEEKLQDELRLHRLSNQSDERDKLLDSALGAFRVQNYSRAAESAESLLRASPNKEQKFRAHFILGHCYKHSHDYAKAVSEFSAANDVSDGDDSALLELGNIEDLQNHHDSAERYYKQAIDAHGVNAAKARWNLVLLYHSEGKLEEANEELKKLPAQSNHNLTLSQLDNLVSTSQKKKKDAELLAAHQQESRARFFGYIWRTLIGAATFVVVALIATLYRRTLRDPTLTEAQRLDFVGKLIGGLFSMLSLLGGTMLGLLLAK